MQKHLTCIRFLMLRHKRPTAAALAIPTFWPFLWYFLPSLTSNNFRLCYWPTEKIGRIVVHYRFLLKKGGRFSSPSPLFALVLILKKSGSRKYGACNTWDEFQHILFLWIHSKSVKSSCVYIENGFIKTLWMLLFFTNGLDYFYLLAEFFMWIKWIFFKKVKYIKFPVWWVAVYLIKVKFLSFHFLLFLSLAFIHFNFIIYLFYYYWVHLFLLLIFLYFLLIYYYYLFIFMILS